MQQSAKTGFTRTKIITQAMKFKLFISGTDYLLKVNFRGLLLCTTVQSLGGDSTGPLIQTAGAHPPSAVCTAVPITKCIGKGPSRVSAKLPKFY